MAPPKKQTKVKNFAIRSEIFSEGHMAHETDSAPVRITPEQHPPFRIQGEVAERDLIVEYI